MSADRSTSWQDMESDFLIRYADDDLLGLSSSRQIFQEEYDTLVTVIVAIYNISEYIEDCVKSIVRQTYANIEILLIDDGSTDGSEGICDKLASEDDRIRVFHKQNGGLSDARNFGVAHAKGAYIVFVDGDDIVSSDYIDFLARPVMDGIADLSICDFKDSATQVDFLLSTDGQVSNQVQRMLFSSGDALVDALEARTMNLSACGKLAKKTLWASHPFPTGKVYEDLAAVPGIILDTERVIHIAATLYGQVERIGSITRSSKIPPHQYEDYFDAICAAREALKEVSDESVCRAIEVRTMVTYARIKRLYRRVYPHTAIVESIYKNACQRLYCGGFKLAKDKSIPTKARILVFLAAYIPFLHEIIFMILQSRKRHRK